MYVSNMRENPQYVRHSGIVLNTYVRCIPDEVRLLHAAPSTCAHVICHAFGAPFNRSLHPETKVYQVFSIRYYYVCMYPR